MCLGYIVYCRVGVVFCGRQSPGGHNVVCGLYDAIKAHNRKSVLLGFVGTYTLVNLCLLIFFFNFQRVLYNLAQFNVYPANPPNFTNCPSKLEMIMHTLQSVGIIMFMDAIMLSLMKQVALRAFLHRRPWKSQMIFFLPTKIKVP